MRFGQVLRYLRQSKGLSQAKLAEDAKISASYLSQLENDAREATLPLLRRIAAILGVPGTVLMAAALADEYEGPARVEMEEVVQRLVRAVGPTLQQSALEIK